MPVWTEALSTSGSVTHWIGQLQAGTGQVDEAAQKLWERYFQGLVGLARAKLQGMARRAADEEDVALSAFDSFCRGVERGQFPRLDDRDNLWQLLVVITARKAAHLRRHETQQKRGGGDVRGESAWIDPAASSQGDGGIDQVIGPEPTPDFAVQVAEQCRLLLDRLQDEELAHVALMKMEGFSTEEIAARLGCVPRTVERKLRLIRDIWSQEP